MPSFKSLDPRNEFAVYFNTLTKPFATGIRLGYGILPPAVAPCRASQQKKP